MRFEDQVIAIYGQRGHNVRQEISRNDITTDLVMESAKKETWIVRCVNHVWTDLDTVKDVYQVMLAEHAQQCAVVASGAIADEAYAFAQGKPIFLMNSGKFYEYYQKVENQTQDQSQGINYLEESVSSAGATGNSPFNSAGCWWGFAALGLLLLVVILVRQPFSGTMSSNNQPALSSTSSPATKYNVVGTQGLFYFVVVDKILSNDKGALKSIADEVCGNKQLCYIRFWADASEAASGIPMTEAQVNSQVAGYDRNRTTDAENLYFCGVGGC